MSVPRSTIAMLLDPSVAHHQLLDIDCHRGAANGATILSNVYLLEKSRLILEFRSARVARNKI